MTTAAEILAMLRLGPATTREIILFCDDAGAVLAALHDLHLSDRITRAGGTWRRVYPSYVARRRDNAAGDAVHYAICEGGRSDVGIYH